MRRGVTVPRLRTLVGALLAWELGWWLWDKADRRKKFAAAEQASRAARKPMLVVGEPDGEYPCPSGPGDVLVDLRDKSACPNYARTSVEDLSRFRDKQFAVAFASHVLEHVCDPQRALRELERVADRVIIARPAPWQLMAWLVPGHRWIMLRRDETFEFLAIPWRSQCNLPTRRGT